MTDISFTENERTVLSNIVARHWADAEFNRLVTEERHGSMGPRPAVLDALFQAKDLAEVELLRFTLEAVNAPKR
jgi:hypothetical protein